MTSKNYPEILRVECSVCGSYISWGKEYREHMEEHFNEWDKAKEHKA